MKQNLFILHLLTIFILFLLINSQINLNLNKPTIIPSKKADKLNLKEYPVDDETAKNIQDHIFLYANKIMKSSNLSIKKILNGELPDSYSREMKLKAKKIRNDKKSWMSVMSHPTEIWGFCVYPKYKVNSMTWCDQIYALKNKDKVADCKNSFCNVCCDHFPNILKSMTSNSETSQISKKLMFDKKSGFKRINRAVTLEDVEKCRSECRSVYPVKLPLIYPAPPRDQKLGRTSDDAAKSCADIKKWGDINAKSGEYWIDLGTKGKVKPYCDMETDKGGWTLFFNYVHRASQEILIDSSRLPKNIEDSSHINILEIGIEESYISELRFFCTELNKFKYFTHFKTTNKKLIGTAYTGDQTILSPDDLVDGYSDLPFPDGANKWVRIINKNNVDQIDYVGGSNNGSFWNTPFGSIKGRKFWTVKNGRFECGTNHKDSLDSNEANLVTTHHMIMFRGDPPTEEFARVRYTTRNFNQ